VGVASSGPSIARPAIPNTTFNQFWPFPGVECIVFGSDAGVVARFPMEKTWDKRSGADKFAATHSLLDFGRMSNRRIVAVLDARLK
jgi:hypothetical protein